MTARLPQAVLHTFPKHNRPMPGQVPPYDMPQKDSHAYVSP